MRTFGRIILIFIATLTAIGLTTAIASAGETHTVQPGDTLSQIAADHQVPGGWQALYEQNADLIDDPHLIFPGQEFVIDGDQARAADRSDRSDDRSSDGTASDSNGSGGKVRPATGSITSPYLGGYRSNGGHSGTDFDGTDGNVYAAADGTVVSGFWDGAYGNKLVISHGGGVETWYAHLASFTVSADEHVSAGQKIGNIGETGNATGPHLHFEVRINGEMTDPLAWLD